MDYKGKKNIFKKKTPLTFDWIVFDPVKYRRVYSLMYNGALNINKKEMNTQSDGLWPGITKLSRTLENDLILHCPS